MHSGKFQWNVLPFGIGIGVQIFSFVINKAIGHCSDFATNYLDDIIVYGKESINVELKELEELYRYTGTNCGLKCLQQLNEIWEAHANELRLESTEQEKGISMLKHYQSTR